MKGWLGRIPAWISWTVAGGIAAGLYGTAVNGGIPTGVSDGLMWAQLGAGIGLALSFLRPLRARGRAGRYAAWIIAAWCGFGVLAIHAVMTESEVGALGIFLAVIFGLAFGIVLGVFEEWWKGRGLTDRG